MKLHLSKVSSYRTYEEWKPFQGYLSFAHRLGSYRTYEEWKRRSANAFFNAFLVLTVPMRNGNHRYALLAFLCHAKFLPYL